MRGTWIDYGLSLLCAATLLFAVQRMRDAKASARAVTTPREWLAIADREQTQSVRTWRGRSPFGIALTAQEAASRPISAQQVVDVAAEPARPQLTTHAVAGGPPWTALVSGDETGRARVVRIGDQFAGVSVVHIDTLGVTFARGDSSWLIPLARRSQFAALGVRP